jgi:hypothetical protein
MNSSQGESAKRTNIWLREDHLKKLVMEMRANPCFYSASAAIRTERTNSALFCL